MKTIAPFLWFNGNAEEAAELYLSVFPHARKLAEVRSKGGRPMARGDGGDDHDRAGGPGHGVSEWRTGRTSSTRRFRFL